MYKSILFIFLLFYQFALAQKQSENKLSVNHYKISAQFNQFDYQQYNKIINTNSVDVNKNSQLAKVNQSTWEIRSHVTPVIGVSNAYDYTIVFKCLKGQLNMSNVAIKIDFDNWDPKNYVLMPSVAYNGNKYKSKKLRYSPKLYDIKDIGPDKPIIINDVPKLNDTNGISRIQERTGSLATPAIGFVNNEIPKGLWMLTQQGNQWGDYGLGFEETRDRKKASMNISSPIVRELYNYTLCDAHNPSWDKPANFKSGDEIKIVFRLYDFEVTSLQSFYDKYSQIRNDLNKEDTIYYTLTYDACKQTLEAKFNQQNYVPEFGYFSVGMRENYLQDWQIGWTGGMISTYPLLFYGNDTTVKRVLNNFDWLFPNGISPSGFYWDAGQKGNQWFGGDIRNPHTKNWHLVRKSGDAIWYILKQFALMQKMGIDIKQSWRDGNQKVCDAFVNLWQKNHQLGQFVDANTGEIIVGGSSSGAIVPAALMLASQFYHNSIYAKTAFEIGDYYNDNFVTKGISCGGPGDALQAFDSESSYALVETYVTLYEYTNDIKWLTIAQNAAKQFATWVVSYNYQFDKNAALYKAGIHTKGAVYANIQNKHAAPGICTASGIGLLKLYRFTGDPFYLNLLYDIAHNIPQYLPHPIKPIGTSPIGWVSERINMTDWEGPESIGYILPISTWAETSLMLTTIEIPGLYINTKENIYKAFDNVEIKKVIDFNDHLILSIFNPTKVDANFSIFEDTDKNKMIGEAAFYGSQKIKLKAGETIQLSFKK